MSRKVTKPRIVEGPQETELRICQALVYLAREATAADLQELAGAIARLAGMAAGQSKASSS
jgi:hypothetical protein